MSEAKAVTGEAAVVAPTSQEWEKLGHCLVVGRMLMFYLCSDLDGLARR